jgi:uncharacterized membrane protein
MKFNKQVTSYTSRFASGTDRAVSFSTGEAVRGLLAFYGLSLVAMVLSRFLPSVLTVPFVVVSLSFVPGALFLLVLRGEGSSVDATHVLYAFGSSLVILMFVGALVNVVLPYVGVARPLMPVPLAAGVTVAVGVLAGGARLRDTGEPVTLEIPDLWAPVPLGLLLVPLLSIIGVELINRTGVSALLVGVLVAVAAVPLVAVRRLDDRWYSLAVWTTAAAVLYHKGLWQFAGFGGRPHGIKAWEAGRWSPGVRSIEPYSSELLQNGVLFPLFARLSDLFIITQYEVVNPFFVSFIPLAMYVTFRQYADTRIAFLGASLFAFCHPFYYQYPTAGRAATPVIFLVLFAVVLSNERLAAGSRAVLGLGFLLGVVVTHYGTSYYVAVAFIAAILIVYSLRVFDDLIGSRFGRADPAPDGGTVEVGPTEDISRSTLFSLGTVFFFITAALGWYLYTRGGWKFDLLPSHASENIATLLSEQTEQGRTTARVTERYSSTSIEFSKYIYVMTAMMTALGFVVVYYGRLVREECSFDDSYLALSTALFGIFGTTTILHNWGGGRPMMITFSFTTVFAVVGGVWLADGIGRGWTAVTSRLPASTDLSEGIPGRTPDGRSVGLQVIAAVLFVFFLLNAGVAAATVFQGELAPSNVPAQSSLVESRSPQSQVTVHRGTDVMTHIWVVQYLDEDYNVYGDTFAARQYDWFRPDIAARTPAIGGGYTPATKPEVLDVERQQAGTQPGYILVMGHNLELGAAWPGKFSSAVPLANVSLDRRNVVYTTGESRVYFYSEPERPAVEDSDGDQ